MREASCRSSSWLPAARRLACAHDPNAFEVDAKGASAIVDQTLTIDGLGQPIAYVSAVARCGDLLLFADSSGQVRRLDSTTGTAAIDRGVIVGSFNIGREGHGFVGIPRSPVDVTINGADGPVTIDPGQPLQVHLQFTAPPDGALNPAEVYIGVVSPLGLLWLDPATGTFVPTPTVTFAGAVAVVRTHAARELAGWRRAAVRDLVVVHDRR